MRRREALSSLIGLLSIALPSPAWAISLVDLKGLGEAIDAASEAFGKLADSVGRATILGDRGLSVLAARHAREQLKNIDAQLTDLVVARQSDFVDDLKSYVALWNGMNTGRKARNIQTLSVSWQTIVSEIKSILNLTSDLLDTIRNNRSDFVLDSAYGTLIAALNGKAGVLARLSRLDTFPDSGPEVAEIDTLAAKYDILRQKTLDATTAMSAYISKMAH